MSSLVKTSCGAPLGGSRTRARFEGFSLLQHRQIGSSGRARHLFLAGVSAAAMTAASAGATSAQTLWVGGTAGAPTDWTNAANWSPAAVPTAGNLVQIDTVSQGATVLGVSGAAVGNAGTFYVGRVNGSVGNLTVQNGSTLNSGVSRIGELTGSTGVATITGGSIWNISANLVVGNFGTGTLNTRMARQSAYSMPRAAPGSAGGVLAR